MDELDEQLRQLSIINSRLSFADANKEPSLDGNHIDVAKLVNSIEEKNNLSQEYQGSLKNRLLYSHDLNAAKKVGPIVPPKPLKKSPNIPEVFIIVFSACTYIRTLYCLYLINCMYVLTYVFILMYLF